jgi:hypothetical protein
LVHCGLHLSRCPLPVQRQARLPSCSAQFTDHDHHAAQRDQPGPAEHGRGRYITSDQEA